ncbi:MAG TPA: hypothetical protein RMH99_06065 [Sandaracinaceae bacterium LLY-WYZ-13_1]|nr:hypothetical protein [Sandaracinaceae bacterium LLY-WYZ-13_1]
MTRRALRLATISILGALLGLVACGDEEEAAETVDTTPIVGLMEVPISRNNQGTEPSNAANIEISPTELRLNHQKVADLERGRPPEGQVSDHVITPLREALSSSAARSRAALTVHASVPYLTLVETMNTLQSVGLREAHFAVRTLGESPQQGWMPLTQWQVAEAGEEVEFPGRAVPWSAFHEQWQEVYEACREPGRGRFIDCDFPYENIAEGGELLVTLWTRGQGMKVTFQQVNAPEEEESSGGGGGGVALIEGIAPAPAPAEGEEEEEGEPATQGSFTVRHQEATADPSALSNLSQPVCGNRSCRAAVTTDATTMSMRVISMLGAVFANGFEQPQLVFQIPEE